MPPISAPKITPGGASGKEPTCQWRRPETRVRSLGRSPGGGNGNPLQYSCLENSMDRGAWRATVLRVPQNRTRLKRPSTHAHIKCLRGLYHNTFLSASPELGFMYRKTNSSVSGRFILCQVSLYLTQFGIGSIFVILL